jgi:glycine cleavage system H protein
MIKKELKYSKDHEWIKVEGNKVTVGISHHAQDALGDVVFVELPEAGDEVAINESFGTVESVKAVSDVYSPVTGKVLESNQALLDSPELVNSDPYGEGWMIVVELEDEAELNELLSAEEYEAFLKEAE